MTDNEKPLRGRQKKLENMSRKPALKFGSDLPKDVFVENPLDEELNAQYNFEDCGCLFRDGKQLTLVRLISLK